MQKLFESWKRRKLTIFGKTCIINSLGISKLIYRASTLRMSELCRIKTKTNGLILNTAEIYAASSLYAININVDTDWTLNWRTHAYRIDENGRKPIFVP